MALYIPHSIFHLARVLYVRPETFGPTTYLRQTQAFLNTYEWQRLFVKKKWDIYILENQVRLTKACQMLMKALQKHV